MNDNYITCQEENGSINISEDVIYSLVRSAPQFKRWRAWPAWPIRPAASWRSCLG